MAGDFLGKFKNLFNKKDVTIIMGGLDNVGKTVILYKLKLGQVVTTIVTMGFNVETIEYKNIYFTIWDLAGVEKARECWRGHYPTAQGLIFVVDSHDRERVSEAKDELSIMLADDKLKDVPLLVFANKQDLRNVMNTAEIIDKLNLHSLHSHNWYIQAICAIRDYELYEGLDWLYNQLKNAK